MATYSIRNLDKETIEKIMHISHENTGSKSIEYACKQFILLYEERGKRNLEKAEMEGKYYKSQQILENLKKAFKDLLK